MLRNFLVVLLIEDGRGEIVNLTFEGFNFLSYPSVQKTQLTEVLTPASWQ